MLTDDQENNDLNQELISSTSRRRRRSESPRARHTARRGFPEDRGYAPSMPPQEAKPSEIVAALTRLEVEVRQLRDDLNARLDAIVEALEMRNADEEAEALAAERVRGGAAERTRDGAEVLAELGIETR
jgi:hypothetical protein